MFPSSIGSSAASMVTASLARFGAAASAAGRAPGVDTAAALSQSATASDVSIAVLKKVLDLEADAGAQVARMIGSSVDLQA